MKRRIFPSLLSAVLVLSVLAGVPDGVMGQDDVATSAEQVRPILVGSQLPDAQVERLSGESVSLPRLAVEQPMVLVVYRGGWCPYCSRQLAELHMIRDDLNQLGYRLVAVSMDHPAHLKESVSRHSLDYELFSDHDATAVRALGLAYRVDPQTVKRYKKNGIDLEAASGHDHHILPVPAVFLVDRRGTVLFKYANPDYKIRLKSKVLLEAARAYYPADEDSE